MQESLDYRLLKDMSAHKLFIVGDEHVEEIFPEDTPHPNKRIDNFHYELCFADSEDQACRARQGFWDLKPKPYIWHNKVVNAYRGNIDER